MYKCTYMYQCEGMSGRKNANLKVHVRVQCRYSVIILSFSNSSTCNYILLQKF